MFLKKMFLKGFKSFAYPIEINFTDGLTVVVGPNGSGKSNINDALKWVLGEASKKNLRASESNDMIFAGSEDEKPSEYAEVILYIDNHNQILNHPDKEISVSRKSYASKDKNEYYINKELVRRKDVKDLFLDTGLGNVDLSIISQGSITKIVEAKPKDIRNILNEAAGVSRYQKQKEEALNNLKIVDHNIEIIQTKSDQLEKQIKPLKKAADKAKYFQEIKKSLADIELPIIKSELINWKENLSKFKNEYESSSHTINFSDNKIKEINQKQTQNQLSIIEIDKEIKKLNLSSKELMTSLENKKLTSTSDIDNLQLQIQEKQSAIKISKIKIDDFSKNEIEKTSFLQNLKKSLILLQQQRGSILTLINKLDFQIEQTNKESQIKLDYGTKKIVDNKNIFNDFVGLVSDLFKVENRFSIAIRVGLGGQLKNVVMKDENSIKQAIAFLKEHNYGTSTFIPYEQVKPKSISLEFQNVLKNIKGYLGTLSENIKFDKKYFNLFEFLGGSTLIFTDFNASLNAAKITNYRFKIISLEGDIIFPGFVVRGGSNRSLESTNEERLKSLKDDWKTKTNSLRAIEFKIQEIDSKLEIEEKLLNSIRREEAWTSERLNNLEASLNTLLVMFEQNTGKKYINTNSAEEISQFKTFDSLEHFTLQINNKNALRETLNRENVSLKIEEEHLRNDWKASFKDNEHLKTEIGKLKVMIERNLNILQIDYKINEDILFSKVFEVTNVDAKELQNERISLRSELEKIGYVNFEAIEEYEKLDEEFTKITNDLNEFSRTKTKLLSTITEMDKKMEEKFSDIFEKINKEFEIAFIQLFNGGTARIKYSDPDDILNSGIEIYARSPGKNVKNLQLYSGGEKSMIAIALIFSINKVRNLPLLILDEVEAALDEANVERFANFAKEINKFTQVIITSHRPGTMEKADILYGVTMQKKGITTIFTVELENAIEMTKED